MKNKTFAGWAVLDRMGNIVIAERLYPLIYSTQKRAKESKSRGEKLAKVTVKVGKLLSA